MQLSKLLTVPLRLQQQLTKQPASRRQGYKNVCKAAGGTAMVSDIGLKVDL